MVSSDFFTTSSARSRTREEEIALGGVSPSTAPRLRPAHSIVVLGLRGCALGRGDGFAVLCAALAQRTLFCIPPNKSVDASAGCRSPGLHCCTATSLPCRKAELASSSRPVLVWPPFRLVAFFHVFAFRPPRRPRVVVLRLPFFAMALRFVSTEILSSTDGLTHGETKTLETEEADVPN